MLSPVALEHRAMVDYRLYLLDPSGHIRHAIEFCCADDEAAMAEAERQAPGGLKELWQRARMVRRWDARENA